MRDDTRPARARRRGERTRRAVLRSLSRNLRIEDPTDVGFLTGFGAVILIDVAPQVRKAQVAKKYAAAAVWRATAARSGADLHAGTMPLVFGMTLCEADPELIENTLSSLPRDARPCSSTPRVRRPFRARPRHILPAPKRPAPGGPETITTHTSNSAASEGETAMTYSVLEGSAALGRRALTRVQRVPRQAWRFIMGTGHEHKRPLEQGLEHINPIKAQLLKIFGPADGRGNPLVGTQYDPVVRQKIETERQHERWARQDARRHGHPELRHSRLGGGGAQPESHDHSTPDA